MKTVRLWCENPRESSQNSSLLFQDPSLLFAILKNALKNIFIYQNHSSIVFRTRLLYFSTLIITPQNPSIFNPQNPYLILRTRLTSQPPSLLIGTYLYSSEPILTSQKPIFTPYMFSYFSEPMSLILKNHPFSSQPISTYLLLGTYLNSSEPIFTPWNPSLLL